MIMKLKTRFLVTLWTALCCTAGWAAGGDVTVEKHSSNKAFTIRNDYVSVYISTEGEITSLLRYQNNDRQAPYTQLISGSGVKGYFSFASGGSNTNYSISNVYVKQQTADVVEVQYVTNWNDGIRWMIHYIVTRDVSGVYNYVQVEGSASAGSLSEARMGLRCDPNLFNYAYVNDDLQAEMPTPSEMASAETVTDATYRLANGTIYTKYDYAAFQKDDQLHGMMGSNIGVWSISPSMEWLNGGVMRQDLTVHATDSSPILLRHFHGNHFGGVGVTFGSGQTKLYGPHLLYVNQSTASDVTTAHNEMIADAKAQTATEMATFPQYSWMRDTNIKQRGTVTGQLSLGSNASYFGTTKYQVILAQTGKKPMLQGDGYQFWAETDESGYFTIEKVRPGTYSLWAYALNGAATGYYEKTGVTVTNGSTTALGTLAWTPDKYGENSKILWQIGEANHLSSGYNMSGKKREFGQWADVPATITYTIGTSNPATDWYYAQTKNDNWIIKYNLSEMPTNPLRLTIATAGAANAKLNVKVPKGGNTLESLYVLYQEHDGSVSRSATLAGRDSLAVIDIPVNRLQQGDNYIYLNAYGIPDSGMGGLMYDCIKLESNEPVKEGAQTISTTAELSFKSETADNSDGLTEIVNYNNTGFYLRGNTSWTIPVRVPGKDTRNFTFSDGSTFSSQNFATLKSQAKNDYSNQPAANATVVEKNRMNIGFQTTTAGKVYVAFQSSNSPAADSKLRLAMNGTVVKEVSLPEAAGKTARCDVLEYEASSAGTFFIDAYGAPANVFYVKFVPQGTDGIVMTTMPQHRGSEAVYNLNGQRVTRPTKGLYIVNGKKVVIK